MPSNAVVWTNDEYAKEYSVGAGRKIQRGRLTRSNHIFQQAHHPARASALPSQHKQNLHTITGAFETRESAQSKARCPESAATSNFTFSDAHDHTGSKGVLEVERRITIIYCFFHRSSKPVTRYTRHPRVSEFLRLSSFKWSSERV